MIGDAILTLLFIGLVVAAIIERIAGSDSEEIKQFIDTIRGKR